VGYSVLRPEDLEFEPREFFPGDERSMAALTDRAGFKHSRANIWRYPPGNKGRRHRDLAQEETFVILRGTLTMYLGEPPKRFELPAGSVVHVEARTPLQLRNEGAEEVTLYAYGAPPEHGHAEFLDDAF
jgi:mannose-6-phosphate isomerase-like protein (cupin superfamily)